MRSSVPLPSRKRLRRTIKPTRTRRWIYGLVSVPVNLLRSMAICLGMRSNWRRAFVPILNLVGILVAQVVRDQYSGKEQLFSDLGEITPKGFDRAIHVYEVQWADYPVRLAIPKPTKR